MKEKIIEIKYKDLELKVSANFRNGKKGNVIFIHGLLGDKSFFKDIWSLQEFKEFSILTLDLIGFGDSSKPKNFSYNLDEQAEVCRIAIEKLKLDKIKLVAHSLGGAVGLLLISKIPERISSFISLEGCMIGKDLTISKKVSSMPYEKFKRDFEEVKYSIMASKNENTNFWNKWKCKSGPYEFYRSCKSLVKWCNTGKLINTFLNSNINKYYIYGEKNSKIPILGLIKNKSQLIEITKSGHFMMIDNPREFYLKLLNSL